MAKKSKRSSLLGLLLAVVTIAVAVAGIVYAISTRRRLCQNPLPFSKNYGIIQISFSRTQPRPENAVLRWDKLLWKGERKYHEGE